MQNYQSEDIRNLAVIGHGSSGKTMLCESMLATAGVIGRLGDIAAGSTVSDCQPDEQKRQISISASPLHLEWQKRKINVIDTPGYSDFVGEIISSLSVVDNAILTISGTQGIEVGTEQSWELAGARGITRMIVVTALDKEHTRFEEILEAAKNRLGKKVFPLQIPVNPGPGFNQIADIIRGKLITYNNDGSGKYEESEIPSELKERVSALHQELIEFVAESDDALLEKFFEEGGLSEEEMRAGLHHAVKEAFFIPLFCAAGQHNIGVARLLDFMAQFASSPSEQPPLNAMDQNSKEEVEISCDDGLATIQVFKTINEAHVGELSFFRVISGKVNQGLDLVNTNRRKTERLGQLFLFNGKERTNITELFAGDIGTVVKLKETHTGDTLCDSKRQVILPVCEYPTSNVEAAIAPKSKGDEDKLGMGLATLHAEDPTFIYRIDPEIKQTVINGQGELHLQVSIDRMKRRFNIDVSLFEPRIPFRETIKGKGDSKYRHKKQSGGAGQFAEVWMRVESLPRGSGVEFIQSLVGQNVDRTFVVSVEKGVKAASQEGVLAGYLIVDTKVDFYDGKQHPVDSKDIAFQIAGRGAFREAFMAAKPCLLEPIYEIAVKVPEEYMGDVMGDISSRRGKILGMDSDGTFQIVKAHVPQANLYQYATTLRSITGGRGIHSQKFDHYAEMPKEMEKKVIEESQREEEE